MKNKNTWAYLPISTIIGAIFLLSLPLQETASEVTLKKIV